MRRRLKNKLIKPDSLWKKAAVGASLILFLQILGPFTKSGLFWGHDTQKHLINLKQFELGFRQGQFPVRLIDWIVPGYNQPLFNFYQPGFYYIYLLPKLLGFTAVISLKVTLVSLWFLSAGLMFLFAKSHFGTLPAILAAYFYAIAPYHILDILVRAAFPEVTAMSFTPGIFWSIKKYFDTGRSFWLTLLSLFTAAVTISHPPTIIMFIPPALLYIIYHLYQGKSTKAAKQIGLAALVGFGLTSFFLLPAFFEQNYVNTNFLRLGHFDFHNHFVCLEQLFKPFWGGGISQAGCDDGMSFQLGTVHWAVTFLLVAVLILRFLVRRVKIKAQIVNINILSENDCQLFLIALAGIVFSIYMTLAVSQPVWETLPYLPYILYTWRFLAPATFLSSFIAGGLILIFKTQLWRLFAFLTLMLSANIAYSGYLKPLSTVSIAEANIIYSETLGDAEMESYGLFPEEAFFPQWTHALPPQNDRPQNEVRVATDSAEINGTTLKAHLKEYKVSVKKPTVARFYTHYFPGWKVFVDNRQVVPNFDNVYGYMDVPIPTGNHQIRLVFKNTPIRTIANILTINFAIVTVAMVFLFGKKEN